MILREKFQGDFLSLEEYKRDFQRRQWQIDDQDSWKIERQQHFREPGFPSWEAFDRGDWKEALRLIEDERGFLDEFMRKAAEARIELFRVRVVEEPITPYLQWELHLLRVRAECGERISVIAPEVIAEHEEEGRFPELLTLGDQTLYRILYDGDGVLKGAERSTDRADVARCRELARTLYDAGEPMADYFDRVLAHLPAPEMAGCHERSGA